MVQTPGAARAEAKRAEILRKAAAVFGRKGFHKAGMRDIARGLGMAPGALYYYFESKEDLLYSCQMLSLRRLLTSAREIAGSDDPADLKLGRLVRAHLAHILEHLGGGLAHVEFQALPGEQLASVVAHRDEYEAILRGVVVAGIESGVFVDTDVKLVTLTLLGALNWTVVWWKPEGESVDVLAERMTETILGGLKKRRAR